MKHATPLWKFGSRQKENLLKTRRRSARLRGIKNAHARLAWVALIALCASHGHALAADGDLFTPSVFGGLHYDSNYFRLPDEPIVNRVEGQTVGDQGSAITRTVGAGLRLDKVYGLQEVLVDATVTRYSYSNFSSLDSTGHDVSASYVFKVSPEFGGALIYRTTSVPGDQADTGFTTVSNIRTTTTKRLDTDWLAGAALHPRLSIFEDSQKSSLPDFQQENSRTRSVSGSLIYTFPSNNTLEAYYRKARGNYEDLLPDPTLALASNFSESQTGARLHWVFTGLSTLDADAGYLDRTHGGLPARNFSRFVGNLSINYLVTGKTHIQLFVSQALYSSQSDISSYGQDDRVNLIATWAATNKISLIPSLVYDRQKFAGAVASVPTPLREITRTETFEVRWAVLRELDLSAIIGHETRSATLPGYEYTNRSGELNARVHF